MGLKEEDFWQLSFKEFDLLRKRHELHEYRQWERSASLICMVYNVHKGKRARALKVSDIVKNPLLQKQTPRDMADFFKELTIKQGGEVNG